MTKYIDPEGNERYLIDGTQYEVVNIEGVQRKEGLLDFVKKVAENPESVSVPNMHPKEAEQRRKLAKGMAGELEGEYSELNGQHFGITTTSSDQYDSGFSDEINEETISAEKI